MKSLAITAALVFWLPLVVILAFVITMIKSRNSSAKAIRAVVELHKPYYNEGLTVGHCKGCQTTLDNITRHVSYPCPTIQAIEKELG